MSVSRPFDSARYLQLLAQAEAILAELRQGLTGLAGGELPALTLPVPRLPRPMKPADIACLFFLARKPLEAFSQEDMAGRGCTGYGVVAVRRALTRLREQGLTWRPFGDRGGEAITEAGLARLAALKRQPERGVA